jgi:hypothetical protein
MSTMRYRQGRHIQGIFVMWLEENYKYGIKHMRISGQQPEVERIRKGNSPTHMRGFYILGGENHPSEIHRNVSHLHGPRSRAPDLTHANHLVPDTTEKLTDGEVLGMRARQLEQ